MQISGCLSIANAGLGYDAFADEDGTCCGNCIFDSTRLLWIAPVYTKNKNKRDKSWWNDKAKSKKRR